jgi:hypothetical protein
MAILFYDTAMYAPALQPGYISAASGNNTRAMPGWMQATDLDFLKSNSPFFHHPVVLYSAGHISNYKSALPSMLSGKDESNTVILGDSGGYQYATGARTLNSVSNLVPIFDWLVANTDIAVTFDVPPWTVYEENTRWTSWGECLSDTLEYLTFIEQSNKDIKHPFLNVLQGASLNEAEKWYEAVKHFDFYGWAFAYETKYNFHIALSLIAMILRDFEDKYREGELWLHFLGVSDMQTFVLLNALQKQLRVRLGHDRVQITFDTSSPFQSAGKWGQHDDMPVFKNTLGRWQMSIPSINFGPLSQYSPCDPFPSNVATVVANKLEMGDLIINKNDGRGNRFDSTSSALIANHNLQVQLDGFQEAAKRMARPRFMRKSLMAPCLVDACDCIEYLLTLPAHVKDSDLETEIHTGLEECQSEYPLAILFDELIDVRVIKTLVQAKNKAKSWPWWKIFEFKKPWSKSK